MGPFFPESNIFMHPSWIHRSKIEYSYLELRLFFVESTLKKFLKSAFKKQNTKQQHASTPPSSRPLRFLWTTLSIMFTAVSPPCAGGQWWVTLVAKYVFDLGNQHNNGPHQDQIFDNPSSLCLTLWLNPPKICSSWGRADAPSRLFTKGVGLSLHFFVFFHRPIYSVYGLPFTVRHNATTITLPSFLFFFPFPTLRPQANYSGAVSVLS